MITAFVLTTVERTALPHMADRLLEVEGVAEVYSVAGEYDFVAVLRVAQYDDLARIIPEHLAQVDGLVRTHTLMAFRCHSRHDLERMWNIGGLQP